MCGLTTQRTDYIIEVSNDTLEAVGWQLHRMRVLKAKLK